jgi:hypothetical protein
VKYESHVLRFDVPTLRLVLVGHLNVNPVPSCRDDLAQSYGLDLSGVGVQLEVHGVHGHTALFTCHGGVV